MEGSWGLEQSGVDEALDDPGVYGNIPWLLAQELFGFFAGSGGRGQLSHGEETVLPLPPFSIPLSY